VTAQGIAGSLVVVGFYSSDDAKLLALGVEIYFP